MTFELALRATELLLGLSLLQSSAEHLRGHGPDVALFALRVALCVALLAGLSTPWVMLALSIHSLAVLHRFDGPYNGGSDRMALLILYCATAAHWLPGQRAQEMALGYLGLQLVLSYFISGQVKFCNSKWRNGQALADVFRFSAYPVSGQLRVLAHRQRLLFCGSWAVIGFELAFPLALLDSRLLFAALTMGLAFHVANAMLFGLNRFVWSWLAAYPSIIWLQTRIEQLI